MRERLEDHDQGEDTYDGSRRHQATSRGLPDLAVGVWGHTEK
jgi:hypothetical protein